MTTSIRPDRDPDGNAAGGWRAAIYDGDGALRGEFRLKTTEQAVPLLEGFLAQHPEESFVMRIELAASGVGWWTDVRPGGTDAASDEAWTLAVIARIKGGSRS
jgi:hypothetical protein